MLLLSDGLNVPWTSLAGSSGELRVAATLGSHRGACERLSYTFTPGIRKMFF